MKGSSRPVRNKEKDTGQKPGGSFEQSYNAQAAVATDTMLVVATPLTQAANDTRQISPMLPPLGHLPEALGTVTQILADAGYSSVANVERCVAANVEPLIATGRESHHLPWEARFTEPGGRADGADAVARMKHRLKTRAGRAL